MKDAVYYQLFITFLVIATSVSTPLDESVSYCEFLGECETISRLQERLCLGNSLLTPYWLPSRDPTSQRCYTALRSRYQKLERLEHESDSLLLLCMIERSMPLTEHQKQYCDSSLFDTVNKLREEDGSPSLDQCFQGTKRFERQCGPLRQCCNAYDRCKDLVKTSFIIEQKETLMDEIREAARRCKENVFHVDNTTQTSNETATSEGFSTLITFTNLTESTDVVKNALYNSPGDWYMALKAKLIKETEDTVFQRHTAVSHGSSTLDKNDNFTPTVQNVTTVASEVTDQPEEKEDGLVPNVIYKWNNAEYRKGIEEYQAWRAQQHLIHSVESEERNETLCESYVRCRRQMFWNRVDQIPLLSTVTLLQIGDRCIGHGDDAFAELYELVIRRSSQLHNCLDRHQNRDELPRNCSTVPTNRIQWSWRFGNFTGQQDITNSADCFAEVNAVQYACAQMRQCCPNFYRCREETFEAKVELRIASLTIQLISQNYDCLMHKLTAKSGG